MASMFSVTATPFLVVDVDVLDRNIRDLSAHAEAAGVALRPHAKTHKTAEIARRQIAAGARGLSVATLSEAEVFAAAGVDDLFVAYPLWVGGVRAARLRALAESVSLRVGVDSREGVRGLADALAGLPIQVLIELDSGMHRTGVPPNDAGEVASAAARAGLDVAGVFTFPGHGYRPDGGPTSASADEAAALRSGASALQSSGLECRERSGGSTPTVAVSGPAGTGATELRPGVYVFNDAQQLELGTCGWNDVALTAVATVINRGRGRMVLDVGSKVLGADRPPWVSGFGRLIEWPNARIELLSEHHAVVVDNSTALPKVGEQVRVVPNHVCSAVNLVDDLLLSRKDEIIGSWPVAARGTNT